MKITGEDIPNATYIGETNESGEANGSGKILWKNG